MTKMTINIFAMCAQFCSTSDFCLADHFCIRVSLEGIVYNKPFSFHTFQYHTQNLEEEEDYPLEH